MIRHSVAVINQSTVVDDVEGRHIAEALNIQTSYHFAQVWGIDAVLHYVPRGSAPPPGKWWLILCDNSDQAGALGYHDLTPEGLPIGKVFAATDKQYGAKVGVTASHELLEMLADPYINLVVQGRDSFYAYENCDACEADEFGYDITLKDGTVVTISDFVYPRYFDLSATGVQLDYRQRIQAPFQILPGGYLSKWTPQGGWDQVHGSSPVAGDRPRVGSRRERRRTPRDQWLVSDPVDVDSSEPLLTLLDESEQLEVQDIR